MLFEPEKIEREVRDGRETAAYLVLGRGRTLTDTSLPVETRSDTGMGFRVKEYTRLGLVLRSHRRGPGVV